jgi:large subunit ribosomal protein L24e
LKLVELNQILQKEVIVKMHKCVYCGKDYEMHRGLTLVMKDGTVKYLCSSKCRKNMLMKRRKVRWVSKNTENIEKRRVVAEKKANAAAEKKIIEDKKANVLAEKKANSKKKVVAQKKE